MRNFLSILFSIQFFLAIGQKDTVVVTDYTKVMVGTSESGQLYPITSLENVTQAGFFLNGIPTGQIRICNPEPLSVWSNGRLLKSIEGCDFFTIQEFRISMSDTLFISFSSIDPLDKLKCDLVVFDELLVVKDEVSIPREVRSVFREFTIIATVSLVAFLGFILVKFPSRVSYLFTRAFTFKASAYEFVNTNFFGSASMNLVIFYSFAMAFVALYLNTLLDLGLFLTPVSVTSYVWMWLKISAGIFGLYIIKWIVISMVANLFRFRGLKNFQLFDFVNFHTILLLPILLLLVSDFIFNPIAQSWLSSNVVTVFPLVIILFVIWFTFKFVNNSPRKKLMIISYLCATEIIPVIIFLGWFYK